MWKLTQASDIILALAIAQLVKNAEFLEAAFIASSLPLLDEDKKIQEFLFWSNKMDIIKATLTDHDKRVLRFVLGEQRRVCEAKEQRRRMRDWKHSPLSVDSEAVSPDLMAGRREVKK